jgi:hypothetical protein
MKKRHVLVQPKPLTMSVTVNNPILKLESNYFFMSRKQKCSEFLKITDPKEDDILEFLLNLHFVLEIGINTFFRNYYKHTSNYDFFSDSKEIDNIDFYSKITIFLHENNFTLETRESEHESRKKVKQIMGTIKNFNYTRNMIVHGHSISEIHYGETKIQSKLKATLNKDYVIKQIDSFKDILNNLNYFIDRINTKISKEQLQSFQRIYLDINFLIARSDDTSSITS